MSIIHELACRALFALLARDDTRMVIIITIIIATQYYNIPLLLYDGDNGGTIRPEVIANNASGAATTPTNEGKSSKGA